MLSLTQTSKSYGFSPSHSKTMKYSAFGLMVSFLATGLINKKANINKKTNPISMLNNKSIKPKDERYLESLIF